MSSRPAAVSVAIYIGTHIYTYIRGKKFHIYFGRSVFRGSYGIIPGLKIYSLSSESFTASMLFGYIGMAVKLPAPSCQFRAGPSLLHSQVLGLRTGTDSLRTYGSR